METFILIAVPYAMIGGLFYWLASRRSIVFDDKGNAINVAWVTAILWPIPMIAGIVSLINGMFARVWPTKKHVPLVVDENELQRPYINKSSAEIVHIALATNVNNCIDACAHELAHRVINEANRIRSGRTEYIDRYLALQDALATHVRELDELQRERDKL